MKFSGLKLFMIVVTFLFFMVMALRIKGVIVLTWLITILRYNLRPRYYLFDKNDIYLRAITQDQPVVEANEVNDKAEQLDEPVPLLAIAERVRLEHIIARPEAALKVITNRRGGLNVHITEVKQES